jgi:ferredoxin--NADP+ reductase
MPVNDQLNAVVSKLHMVNSESMVLRVQPDGWELPECKPGQFVVLALPGKAARVPYPLSEMEIDRPDPDKLLKRAYSIASSSKQKNYLEFYITLIRSGGLTPRLFALKEGDRIFMGKRVSGIFTLDDTPKDANLLFMGTGTGLAPYMSMIRTFLKSNMQRHFAVVHGARHSWDLGYRSELSMLANLVDSFSYIPVLSRPSQERLPWRGETGHVQDIWNRGLIAKEWGITPKPNNTHIFLCGNPNMINDTLAILKRDGFNEHTRKKPGEVHVEKWW